MKQLLSKYLGKTVGINYGGTSTVKGKLVDVIEGVVKLENEDETTVYIPIDKIHLFWEEKEKAKTVGFVTKAAESG